MKKLLTLLLTLGLLPVFVTTTEAQTVWTKSPSNPVLSPGAFNGITVYGIDGAFDSRYALSPSVIFKNGLYKMWYVGFENIWTGRYTIGYAVSEDGVAWNAYIKNPVLSAGSGWESSQIWLSVVTPDLVMYYSGSDGARWSVGVATSTDGLHWTKYSNNPILNIGNTGDWDDANVWGVSVIKMGPSDYRMWYSGNRATGQTKIGYATSTNGLQWTKYQGNPVLAPSSDVWESQKVYVPRVIYANGVFHMFYLGSSSSNNTQIGYAFSSDGIQWTKYSNNPVLTVGSSGDWDSFSLIDHCVILQEDVLRIWYGGRSTQVNWHIGLATASLTTQVQAHQPLPQEFSLSQNYPNPFNPSTTIDYGVPKSAHVTLKVYNSIGQEIATLVDEERVAGSYSTVWNADGLATGTYMVRMTADGSSVVQKMILLK